MTTYDYLTTAEVIDLHRQVMRSRGGSPQPLRSESLLESAVMKAQAAAYYAGEDIAGQAAALGIGISQNQPFLDGNKRTAYAAMVVFLDGNGFEIQAEPLDIAKQLEMVAQRSGTLEEATDAFAQWLRERIGPLPEENQESD